MEFVERLKELMMIGGYNQVSLGKLTGIQHTNLSDFLSAKHLPSYDNLLKLSAAFNCTIEYLLGRTDFSEEKLHPPYVFSLRLRQILKDNNISQEKLKRDLKISGSVLFKWLSGKNKPSTESLVRLADYFDCSIDYLIGTIR